MSEASTQKGASISALKRLQQHEWFRKQSFLRKQGLKLFAVGAALTALSLAFVLHNQAEETLLAAQNRYQQQQNINLDAARSAAVLDQYLTTYRALQEQGLIGQPQRLQWLETLLAVVNQHLIPKVNFVLSRTEPATAANTTYVHETLAMKVTPMRIEFSLIHEGDFDHLVRTLRAQAKGVFSLQSCEITRFEDAGTDQQANPSDATDGQGNFKGTCELLWYSMADITNAWEAAQ